MSHSHVNSSDGTVWLAPSASHTLLEPIRPSTRKHLVDSDDVERVDPHAEMESLFAGSLDDVLVCADTGGLESFRRQLLVLVRDEVAAEWEVIDGSPLSAQVVDTDLGFRDTTVVS